MRVPLLHGVSLARVQSLSRTQKARGHPLRRNGSGACVIVRTTGTQKWFGWCTVIRTLLLGEFGEFHAIV